MSYSIILKPRQVPTDLIGQALKNIQESFYIEFLRNGVAEKWIGYLEFGVRERLVQVPGRLHWTDNIVPTLYSVLHSHHN